MSNRDPFQFSQGMEIDLTPRIVREMLAKRGFYIVGDTSAPGFEIPVVSISGQLHTLAAADQLNPAGLPDTIVAVGPFRLQPANTTGPVTSIWDEKALTVAQEIAQMWGHDRSQFISKIQCAVMDAMRWGASMPIPDDEVQLSDGETVQ